MALQSGGVARQRVARIAADIALIVVEVGVLHIGVERSIQSFVPLLWAPGVAAAGAAAD